MDMTFGTWNVRTLCRSGPLKVVARELTQYTLGLVGVQVVRWDKGGTERPHNYTFLYGKGYENHQLGTGFFICESLLVIGCHI
jgi:hypothetical protein